MVPLSVWMMRESGLTEVTPRQALSLSRACVLSHSTLNSLGLHHQASCSILCLLPRRVTFFATDHRHASPECRACLTRCHVSTSLQACAEKGLCPSPTP